VCVDDREDLEGGVRAPDADVCTSSIQEAGLRAYRSAEGNRGVTVLRRIEGDRCEFLLITLWDSIEAVKAFAGDDVGTTVTGCVAPSSPLVGEREEG
jgi:hypothetical protein